jgi:hypothetical protein
VYGWLIDPVSETECDVTNYVDWSNLPDPARERSKGRWPVVPMHMLEKSVENLERLATS